MSQRTDIPHSPAAAARPAAVTYLRVSSVRQTHTAIDIDADGNSIATQREACLAKITGMSAPLSREFIEPGKSAQSIEKRPAFGELLQYLKEHPEVGYLVVYSRSRAFRNSLDAAITKKALNLMGVRIISCKEDFGTGYMADAMETVSDVFNELQVRQSGEDIRQKLRHKALNGGTISRAKLGYLNIRAEQDGRLYNTIGTDKQRAPLILKVFELYATGDYSLERLEAKMADLGLTTRPSPRSPREQPVGTSKLHAMLSDPYYAGWVTVEGQLVPGRHTGIVDQALFDRVQEVLEARSARGTRDRVLYHFLKGMLFCDRCNQAGRTSRLIYTEAKGRNGKYYGYFKCMGREARGCDLPHLAAWQVEEAICRVYSSLDLAPDFTRSVTDLIDEVLAERQALTRELHAKLTKQQQRLDAKEQRLIDLAADGLLDRTKIRDRSNSIQFERRRIEDGLADSGTELSLGAERLREHLDLATNPGKYYETVPDETRRQLNVAFFEAFFIDDDPIAVARAVLTPPFEEIQQAHRAYQEATAACTSVSDSSATVAMIGPAHSADNRTRDLASQKRHGDAVASEETLASVLADVFPVRVSSKQVVVELRGFEPLTSSMPWASNTPLDFPPFDGHLT